MPVVTKSNQTPFSIDLPKPLREHWEGRFQGTSGSLAELAFDAVAELCFFVGAGTMAGSFTVDCIEPETCGCGGGSGQFSMRRATELE